ncbi:uncharacterized protein TNCV_1600811 [Trichonephila clavipes]|nr:uncharacterized protein TNCV_1600811 [Trichonephila clavipes]
MPYDRAIRHTSSVRYHETFRSIFAVILPLVSSNLRDDTLPIPNDPRYAQLESNLATAPYTVTPAVGALCPCNANAVLRRSPRGLHTRTRLSSLLRSNLDSSLKRTWFHSAAVRFTHARHHSKRSLRWLVIPRQGSTRNGLRNPKYPSTRRLRMVREDTGAPNEGALRAWKAADEAIDCKRVFLTMWRSSRQLVCRGRPETGLRVNGIYRIHWSQHILTTQSDRPN